MQQRYYKGLVSGLAVTNVKIVNILASFLAWYNFGKLTFFVAFIAVHFGNVFLRALTVPTIFPNRFFFVALSTYCSLAQGLVNISVCIGI